MMSICFVWLCWWFVRLPRFSFPIHFDIFIAPRPLANHPRCFHGRINTPISRKSSSMMSIRRRAARRPLTQVSLALPLPFPFPSYFSSMVDVAPLLCRSAGATARAVAWIGGSNARAVALHDEYTFRVALLVVCLFATIQFPIHFDIFIAPRSLANHPCCFHGRINTPISRKSSSMMSIRRRAARRPLTQVSLALPLPFPFPSYFSSMVDVAPLLCRSAGATARAVAWIGGSNARAVALHDEHTFRVALLVVCSFATIQFPIHFDIFIASRSLANHPRCFHGRINTPISRKSSSMMSIRRRVARRPLT
ncbi:uncharacterized protein LOC125536624 isoform X1 [Triticum urartu]|uniref:uncharacterized protein LOC125536624 isoform X1 n=1 Tax=Triticum urartu TaxID=4572 RepID=UPI002042C045|nr:uncharacterized protein LOC125536624 isoform X1 [Triticum urartu]XP_048555829.1 uncharacterized protein LOC125536624 isoform X1 [Triticum urartu]XP_048555830.1 uncharacterized protein LOC125536624 isoform X1 [Triticum urartu]XP_048555831.1 uncharacterized protein LOC125536624 isoform X1 [Triticum urartu]XP_048555832.1 uncharacterized protein LOC125536624 isoform X1 [Triticum urartu]XP_048555833.1 uncharacterized protein LOC125536624 isoform X1 [Triticum urartu]